MSAKNEPLCAESRYIADLAAMFAACPPFAAACSPGSPADHIWLYGADDDEWAAMTLPCALFSMGDGDSTDAGIGQPVNTQTVHILLRRGMTNADKAREIMQAFVDFYGQIKRQMWAAYKLNWQGKSGPKYPWVLKNIKTKAPEFGNQMVQDKSKLWTEVVFEVTIKESVPAD